MSDARSFATLRVLAIAAWLLPAAILAAQQTGGAGMATPRTAGIAGLVVSDDSTPMAVRRATVTLGDGAATLLIAITDDNGMFEFTGLPAGRFTLSASKGGYLPAAYGARRAGGVGRPIVLAAGQRAAGITIRMIKGSVLTGLVVDADGQPVPDVSVKAFRRAFSEFTGERTLQGAPFASSQVTDDRGRYRIWGLEAGEYAVSATIPWRLTEPPESVQPITDTDVQRALRMLKEAGAARATTNVSSGATPTTAAVAYVPVFVPSAVAPADAALVSLGPHEERDGVNIQLRLAPAAKIEGVVTGPGGAPAPNVDITVLDPGPLPRGVIALAYRNATSGKDGRYSITGVTPGVYPMFVSAGYGDAPLWASIEVVVNGRDVDAPIALRPALTISGRMVFDGTSPPPRDLAALLPTFWALRVGPGSGGVRLPAVTPDGNFTLTVRGGDYRVRSNVTRPAEPIAGWSLKSVVIGGVSVEDIAFPVTQNLDGVVVTFTDRVTEIAGTLQDAAGQPVPDYVLLVFSTDKRFWVPQSRRTRYARPESNGQFLIRDLPPGEYFITALPDVDTSEWNDPEFLSGLAAQAPPKIALAEGEKKVQNLKIGGIPGSRDPGLHGS